MTELTVRQNPKSIIVWRAEISLILPFDKTQNVHKTNFIQIKYLHLKEIMDDLCFMCI